MDGWTVIDRGGATDILRIDPGRSFRWVFGEARGDGSGETLPRLDVGASGGHALAVSGSFPRGEILAVIALFDVTPDPR
ncbi:MAG: hypothetical protein ABEH56_04235 [Salinirussus sp.]